MNDLEVFVLGKAVGDARAKNPYPKDSAVAQVWDDAIECVKKEIQETFFIGDKKQ